MNAIQRFILDDERAVTDILNLTCRNGYCHEGSPETQADLRERILMVRLGDLLGDLVNIQPEMTDPRGQIYRPFDQERHSIWLALFYLIRATHLNALDPSLSVQSRFDGKLRRKKIGLQAFTSISLFTDDVERLLRDLYGHIANEALDPILHAAFTIVHEFTRYVRPELWQEHEDAEAWDYSLGIGVPDGYGISSSQHGRGLKGADDLRLRALAIRANPTRYSKYAVQFATKHIGEFLRVEKCSESDDDLPF